MKVAIVYWSGTGNTEIMAERIAEGAKEAGAEVELMTPDGFSAEKVKEYEAVAFGCPAMGDEVLEESEFQPMWDKVKGSLGGKRSALFGSYGWGDGQWMRDWQEDAELAGADLVCDGLIVNYEPDDDAIAECIDLGRSLAM